VLPRTDSSHVGEGRYDTDGAMTAHSEVPNVVEEDHGRGGLWINGFAEERADYNLRSARLTDDSAPEVVEFAPKALHPAWQISFFEIRSTGNDDSCRLPCGVGVDYLNPAGFHAIMLTHIVYDSGYIYGIQLIQLLVPKLR